MEKKDNYKITIVIAAIVITIITIGGSTFAYWQWVSSATNQTNVNVTVTDGISMTITPTTTQTNGLYPITRNNCAIAGANISGHAIVEIVNNTGVLARPQFYLKLKIEDKNGNNITSSYAQYIHFAVASTKDNSPTVVTCMAAPRSGAFTTTPTTIPNTDGTSGSTPVAGWYNSPMITVLNANNHPKTTSEDQTSMSFDAPANKTTTHSYFYWAWIDSSYNAQNVGNEVIDPLQNAKITVSWSETSQVVQVR